MKPLLSARAEADLGEIHRYTASNFGTAQAESYTAKLMDRIDAIDTRSSIGQSYPRRTSPYRRVGCGRHFIYYRAHGDGVLIVRILQKTMLQSRHLA